MRKIIYLILAIAAASVVYTYFVSVSPPAKNSFIVADTQTHALAIDMDANNKLDMTTVLNDQDVILVLHMGVTATGHQKDIIKSEAVLEKFDENHDGIIDANDIVFKSLELMYFEKKSNQWQVRYVPLTQAGVRAIFIDTKYLPVGIREQSNRLRHAIGGVVMADGSTRLMRDIVINEADFPRGG